MNSLGKPEVVTQKRLIALFADQLGYNYLGDWHGRDHNSNIENDLLSENLASRGYDSAQISRALERLQRAANDHSKSLYQRNQDVYSLMRYGVQVKVEAHTPTETIQLIDWAKIDTNHFAIAEEVTLRGNLERRPDIVLYINGLAIAVLELKNSRVAITEGIRQSISNQDEIFNEWFYSTVQFVLAGNDSEGLRYGTIGTSEPYFLTWKEDEDDNSGYKLDKYLAKMFSKPRVMELIHDFVLFDGGVKKLPRVHQYFGVKAAQEHAARHEGGIIWHTQGSGKSIVMVLLAKWLLEKNPDSRIVIITDRDELDKQIEGVFQDAGESIARAASGRDLLQKLAMPTPRIICTLVHKFGVGSPKRSKGESAPPEFAREVGYHPETGEMIEAGVDHQGAFARHLGDEVRLDEESDAWEGGLNRFIEIFANSERKTTHINALKEAGQQAHGDIFVLVDECHRTQSGDFHDLMKARLPDATFIGFTGTPLLKVDKKSSREVFGDYIHTYMFAEAVEDQVVLDLNYEARDVDQELGSKEKIDAWFEAKTRPLNDWQKAALKKRWGTMQNVLSSRSRMERIVNEIVFDFTTKARLGSQRGTAMLVAASIYEACRYFTLFQQTELANRCGIITSYNPHGSDVSREDSGAVSETDKQFIFNTYQELLKDVDATAGKTKTETYEDKVKALFTDEPHNMKLLVVVNKLLTGFDAPSCTYLYIDKEMENHGLFQAICRTNRLDGEDKDFGYIVDFKNLFKKVENAIAVYSAEIDQPDAGKTADILVQDRLDIGKKRLDAALEAIEELCEPVQPPKGDLEHIHFFCGNSEIPEELAATAAKRQALYLLTVKLIRAYSNISGELEDAGYASAAIEHIKKRILHFINLRDIIKNASGEYLDLKAYEADMRHLLDTYIEAKAPRPISDFDNLSLVELIVKSGIAEAIQKRLGGLSKTKESVSESIENNIRSTLLKGQLTDPAFFDKMSTLLDEIIAERHANAIEYEDYLKKIADLAKRVTKGETSTLPEAINSPELRALYNNMQEDEALALALNSHLRQNLPDGWRDVPAKEQRVKRLIFDMVKDEGEVERLFELIKQQVGY